jgi:hypothetical protein
MPGEQVALLLGGDDVVGRADDEREVWRRLGPVTERAERADGRHGLLD